MSKYLGDGMDIEPWYLFVTKGPKMFHKISSLHSSHYLQKFANGMLVYQGRPYKLIRFPETLFYQSTKYFKVQL